MTTMRTCGALALVTAALTGAAASAQDEKLKVQVSYDLGRKPEDVKRIELRPNTKQPLYFYVTNPAEEPKRNVIFELVSVEADGQARDLLQATISKILGNETVRVRFTGVPTKVDKAPEKVEPGKTPAPDWPRLAGLPFQLQIRLKHGKDLKEAKDAEPQKINLPVYIMEPSEYVSVDEMRFDAKNNQLSVGVKAKSQFAGPTCPVQLVLSPELLPGLDGTKDSVVKGHLNEADEEKELVAVGMRFAKGPPRNGRIHLTVDGYERAFVYKFTSSEGQLEKVDGENHMRIHADHYSQPGPKFRVRLEVDGSPRQLARVELGLDRVGNGKAFDTRSFKGLRRQEVQVGASPEGELLFRTEVEDWSVELDTEGITGKRTLRAQIMDGLKGKSQLKLATEQDPRDRNPLSVLAPLTYDKNAVTAEVIFDDTPPELKIPEAPSALGQNQLKVKVKVAPRTENQAPIKQMKVFFGKPAAGGKVPEDAVEAKPAGGDIWEATLEVPADKKGRIDIGVLATTLTGMSGTTTDSVLLVAGKDPGKKASKISGTVRDRGDRAQPNVPVSLLDAKRMTKATVKTNDVGAYAFENVAPGSYFVYSTRAALFISGEVAVTVPEEGGTISKVDIKLTR